MIRFNVIVKLSKISILDISQDLGFLFNLDLKVQLSMCSKSWTHNYFSQTKL